MLPMRVGGLSGCPDNYNYVIAGTCNACHLTLLKQVDSGCCQGAETRMTHNAERAPEQQLTDNKPYHVGLGFRGVVAMYLCECVCLSFSRKA